MKRKLAKITLTWFIPALVLSLTMVLLFTAKPAEAGWPGDTFRLAVDVGPSDGGTVKVDENLSSSYPIFYFFEGGTEVRLEAVPASGYLFSTWGGDLSGSTNPTTIVIDCGKSIIALFSQIVHTLTIQVSGSGSTTPTVGTHNYGEGAVVSITATPDSDWQFDSWSGHVSEPGSVTTTATMDSDITVTANLSQIICPQVNWLLVGGGIVGVLVLVGLLVVLVVRRRARQALRLQ